MRSRLAFSIWVLLPMILWVGIAGADWGSTQSARGVTQEPNDFWYWHRINETVSTWDFDPVEHISYDEDHSFFWHWGPNYLNMPRAWGILLHADPDPVGVLSTDTEFFISHWDMDDNLIINTAEALGQYGVDDDGDGLIDNDVNFNIESTAVEMIGLQPFDNLQTNAADPLESHGTNMMQQMIANTDNESWWVGREPEDYLQEVESHRCGLPGLMWNKAKFYGTAHAVGYQNPYATDYVTWLNRRGANIKVASCSWIGHNAEWAQRLEGNGVLVVTGASNTNWEVQDGGENDPCLVMGGVEKDTYRRARISGPEDGACYRIADATPTATIHANGYWSYSGSVFGWNSDPDQWRYITHDIDSSQISALALGWYPSYGREGSRELDDYIQTTMSQFPGVGGGIIRGTDSTPVDRKSVV